MWFQVLKFRTTMVMESRLSVRAQVGYKFFFKFKFDLQRTKGKSVSAEKNYMRLQQKIHWILICIIHINSMSRISFMTRREI